VINAARHRKRSPAIRQRRSRQQLGVIEGDGLSGGVQKSLAMGGITALSLGSAKSDPELAIERLIWLRPLLEHGQGLPIPVLSVVGGEARQGVVGSSVGVVESLGGVIGAGLGEVQGKFASAIGVALVVFLKGVGDHPVR
jgi:hypothetical protein